MITYTFTRLDASGESTSTVFSARYTFNDDDNSVIISGASQLTTALNSICVVPAYRVIFTVPFFAQNPTRGGHRELKWVLRFRDGANRIFTHEVGTANPALPRIHAGGKTILDPAWSGYNQMRSYLETHVTNRYGNSLTLVEVEEVGRNL